MSLLVSKKSAANIACRHGSLISGNSFCVFLSHTFSPVALCRFLLIITLIWNILPNSQIFIKTLTGRKQAFNFEPENQVLAVKQALQEKEGIQVDQIKLIFSGKQLADNNTLESYNIAAGATIHMVLQLRGGGVGTTTN